MTNKELAAQIMELMGGVENVSSLTHCVTRLRFVLKDRSKAKMKEAGDLDGVIMAVESGVQNQIVIGPKVKSVYEEAVQLLPDTGMAGGEVPEDDVPQEKGVKALLKRALDTLIACFVPVIPVMAGSGMIKVLVVLLQTVGVFGPDSTTATVLNTMGDGVYYFLPFFVAINAAKKMNVDAFLSMVVAAIVLHPNLAALGEVGTSVSFIGLPMRLVSYTGQALPVIFAVWLLKYVDKFADKYSPDLLKIFLRPLIDILVVGSVTLLVLGPISGLLGDAFLAFCNVMNTWGWIAVGLNAALFPIMVLTGTHNATIPLLVQMFANQGFDPIFLPSGMAANIAQAGAAAAVAFRTKNKKVKSTAGSAAVSAALGITEPALYGVNLRFKKPLAAVIIGAVISGCLLGLAGITAPTFVTPSLLTAAVFFQRCPNILLGVLAVASTFVIPFVLTILLGFEDEPEK